MTESSQKLRLGRHIFTLSIAVSAVASILASPTAAEDVAKLTDGKLFAASHAQELLDDAYKPQTARLIAIAISPYSSGDDHYLIPKAYINFYNDIVRKQVRRIIL